MAAAGAVASTISVPAEAHFVLQTPTNWVTSNTRDGTPEKTAPCGNEAATLANGTASAPSGVINAFTPNGDGTTTVSITINEVVPHAGWYRVSLVPGRASTQTTATLPDPPTPANSCAATIASTPALPIVADNQLNHQGAFSAPQTFSVTVPAGVDCTMASPCTLQVVEVMNDGGHFPPGCFYHHCADVALTTGVVLPRPDAATGGGSAGANTTGEGGSGGASSTGSGGTSTAGTGGSTTSGDAAAVVTSQDDGGCAMSRRRSKPIALAIGAFFALTAVARRTRRRSAK
jgi:hypothetical protein